MANERIWAPWRLAYVKDAAKDVEQDCIFCAKPAADDDEQNLIVHRGERAFVILNLFPYTNGHLMVTPYEHLSSIADIPAETVAEMMSLSQQAIRMLEEKYAPHGFNVGFNQGRVAGAGRRAPHPHARRPALGRRQQLHARPRRHAGDAAVDRADVRGAARNL